MIIVYEEMKKQQLQSKEETLCGCHGSIVCAHLFSESCLGNRWMEVMEVREKIVMKQL